MLKEILGVADDPPARRRWFHDDFFDLFVWQAEGEVTLFQLCYGVDSSDRALVWDNQGELVNLAGPALCFNPILGATTGQPAPERIAKDLR